MKLLKVLVAAVLLAAMVTPAVAEDRLSLSGEFRVRGWHKDDGGKSTTSYADQRFRLGGNIAVAEGVSVTFRTDITEANWGSNNSTFGAGRGGSTQQWDRAHVDLTSGDLHFRLGQQTTAWGKTFAVDVQTTGVSFDYRGAVPVSAFVYLMDDNIDPYGKSSLKATGNINTIATYVGGLTPPDVNGVIKDAKGNTVVDANGKLVLVIPDLQLSQTALLTDDNEDSFLAGLRISPSADNVRSNIFAAYQSNGSEEDVYLIGADLTLNLEALTLGAEIDYFDGDASDTIDAMGLQMIVDGAFKLSDAATLGAQFMFAKGADNDEAQYVGLGNGFNGWDPIADVGTSLSNEQISLGRPFDFTGDAAGVVGGRLYANIKVSDAVSLGASVAYLEPEEDKNTAIDSMTAAAAGITYAVLENTSLQAQVQWEEEDTQFGKDDDAVQAGVGVFVRF